ncbi:MAG: DUF3301 domain-containing protein [Steroidobacteraceae bacterium]
MLSTSLLLLIIVTVVAVGFFWQHSLGARERANRAAQDACTRMNLQFLDGTVAFARISLTRVAGRLALRRTYVFDYSAASIERRQGFVILLGQRIESIGFEPDRDTSRQFADRTAGEYSDTSTDIAPSQRNKVLNLDDWRRQHPDKRTPPSNSPHNNSSNQGW